MNNPIIKDLWLCNLANAYYCESKRDPEDKHHYSGVIFKLIETELLKELQDCEPSNQSYESDFDNLIETYRWSKKNYQRKLKRKENYYREAAVCSELERRFLDVCLGGGAPRVEPWFTFEADDEE